MKGKFKLNHLIVHLILLVGVIVVVFPFAWMILTSFKTSGEAMKIPPTIFPEKFVTTAYHTIVTSAIPFVTVYMNTIINTVVTTLVQIVFCSMAGYAFGRIEFPFKNAIFILVLSVLMVPGQIFLLPQYQIVQKLGPALSTLQGQYTTEYPMQMAGAVLAVLPLVVMFFIFQKQFIEGVAQSGIKG